MRTGGPIAGLLLGLVLFAWGGFQGMHVLHLRLQGVRANAVVLRVEARDVGSGRHRRRESFTILRVDEHECTLPGAVGSPGQMLPVHHAPGRGSDCALDSGAALRGPLLTLVPGLLLLVGSWIAYQRARAAVR